MSENILVFWRLRFLNNRLHNFTGNFIKQTGRVPFGLILFSEIIPFSFHSEAMQDFRSRNLFQIIEHFHHVVDIMPVDRSEITELERLKHITLLEQCTLHRAFYLLCNRLCIRSKLRNHTEHLPHFVLHTIVRSGRGDISEIFFECTHIGVDAHAVIIEDYKKVRIFYSTMIESFECETSSHGTIPNHCNMLTFFIALQSGSNRHPQCSRDRRRTMSYTETIVFTL